MHDRHFDDKGKQIVNEGVDGFVRHCSPVQMSNGLQFVVDKELRRHHHEAKHIDEAYESV